MSTLSARLRCAATASSARRLLPSVQRRKLKSIVTLNAVIYILESTAETIGAVNTGFDTIMNLHCPTSGSAKNALTLFQCSDG